MQSASLLAFHESSLRGIKTVAPRLGDLAFLEFSLKRYPFSAPVTFALMTRLFTFLALMISTLIVEGLRGLLQATPRPSGVYGGTVPDATGEIIFNAGHPTFSMDVVILGCPLAVQGLQYQVVHLKEEAYNVKVDHTGTNLVQQVNACGDLRIVIGDFAEMTFYFNPSDNENAIELRSTTEEWEGRFEHT